jgi:hypothetical protein
MGVSHPNIERFLTDFGYTENEAKDLIAVSV